MSKIGGYKIIDLHDVNLVTGEDAVTIAGVHEAIESNYRKPTLLTGLVIDGVEKVGQYVTFVNTSGTYAAKLFDNADGKLLTITVTAADGVQVTAAT